VPANHEREEPSLLGELEPLEQLPVLLHQVREIRGHQRPDRDLRPPVVLLRQLVRVRRRW
jgi:hypothetical protein